MTLDSDNVRFMRIFAGFPGKGASYNSEVIENVFFRTFERYDICLRSIDQSKDLFAMYTQSVQT